MATFANPATAGIAFNGDVIAQVIDESVANTTYICSAAIGSATSAAVWQIQRVVVASGVTTIRWAGTGAFDQVCDNRTSLTYN